MSSKACKRRNCLRIPDVFKSSNTMSLTSLLLKIKLQSNGLSTVTAHEKPQNSEHQST